MFDFHEKRKIRRVLYSPILIVILFLLAFIIGRSVYERYTVERETAQKLHDRMEELELLKQRASLLGAKVEHLKNERGIEEELRSRFDVAKEGEQVVIILEDPEVKGDVFFEQSTTTKQKGEIEEFFDRLKFW